MAAVWEWMSRPDVVFAVSIASINMAMGQRRG